ncbi:hypothetical protein BJ875DRAFT_460234 [Amylocarpus encephaloides]|uniref:Secreted protein n=1 Tax=Amylocarpus encephaloides TaxID=45428 RepID=A0A9P7YK64_9HELO|nr:hypothetical protein BJ875DRAFT_460234 [Amylocarpus encephaloides]
MHLDRRIALLVLLAPFPSQCQPLLCHLTCDALHTGTKCWEYFVLHSLTPPWGQVVASKPRVERKLGMHEEWICDMKRTEDCSF